MPIAEHVIHLESGRLAADTPASSVDRLVGRALAHGENGIVIHFHGGLVSYTKGTRTAEALQGEYLEAGAYPVFFLWESGVVETIVNNLGSISKEVFFKVSWKRLSNIVMRKLGQSDSQRAGGVLPPVDDADVQDAIDRALDDHDPTALEATAPPIDREIAELSDHEARILEAELALDFQLSAEIEKVSRGLRTPAEVQADAAARSGTVRVSTATLMDPAALDELVDRHDRAERGLLETAMLIRRLVSVAGGVVKRFITGRDHGFHATIVEELLRGLYLANAGGIVWGQMKTDTADAFGGDVAVHGGDAFLAALNQQLEPAAPPRIVLVGHSAGAVFVSEFLAHADEVLPPEVVFDVVLQAPAATFAKFSETLTTHRQRIAGFRMFSMDDEREQADQLVPFLYPHSLLYFVSGVVEGDVDMPLLGMQRFYDTADFPAPEHADLRAPRQFLGEADDRTVWSVTADDAPAGHQSQARKHGAFDDEDPATLASVKHIIRNGFEVCG